MTTYTHSGTVFAADYRLTEDSGLNSSVFSEVAYNTPRQQLLLTFKETGRTFVYDGISLPTFNDFVNSGSLGNYYNRYIRGAHDATLEENIEVINQDRPESFENISWDGGKNANTTTWTGTFAPQVAPGFYTLDTGVTEFVLSTREKVNEWFAKQDLTNLDISIRFVQFNDNEV